MIKLDKSYVRGVQAATSAAQLHQYLQNAVELEHSTIPPYLTAMFSLQSGENDEIAQLIRQIVMQEMLHMTISANILIAIGGHPQINNPHFIPSYPGNLPMQIGGADFIVGIEAFSKPLVKNTFMLIEEPENPIPVQRVMGVEQEPEYATIGQFYDAIKLKITELGDGIFTVGKEKQVLSWFPPDQLFPITDVESALAAIDLIKVQGEGTSTQPFESSDDPAHYYKFGEIVAGRKIVKTDSGYAYAGQSIPFNPTEVYPLQANCKIADFAPGTQARTRIEQFAYSYSSLLNALHKCFNGDPDYMDTAIGLMYSLKVEAVALMQTRIPGSSSGLTVGPSFEYINTQGGMG